MTPSAITIDGRDHSELPSKQAAIRQAKSIWEHGEGLPALLPGADRWIIEVRDNRGNLISSMVRTADGRRFK